jgi:spermidine synthase
MAKVKVSSRIVKSGTSRWFSEAVIPFRHPGTIQLSLRIERLVHHERTAFQDILIFDHAVFGRVLVLDGIVQLTQADEFIYHEMLVHPVFLSHPHPRDVLIIGSGDGGGLREALRHPVREVCLVDIDRRVIELSQEHLGFASAGAFRSRKARVLVQDGRTFIRDCAGRFDVVIVDSTDPVGSSTPLYSEGFYRDVFRALKDEGMLVAQVGTFLDFADIIRTTYRKLARLFPSVQTYRFSIPSYLCGDYCFIAASKAIDLGAPEFEAIERRFGALDRTKRFRYYSPAVHRAACTLPHIWRL